MARDDIGARSLWLGYMTVLDGARPSGVLGWVSPVAPVVTQAAAGAGHWAAGRQQRALAAWAGAAGYGLVAWGLGTEAPTPAEARQNMQRLQQDVLRRSAAKAPVTAGTSHPRSVTCRGAPPSTALPPLSWGRFSASGGTYSTAPLTVLAIASQASAVVFSVLRVARAVQRRRPRTAPASPDRRRIGSPAAGSIG